MHLLQSSTCSIYINGSKHQLTADKIYRGEYFYTDLKHQILDGAYTRTQLHLHVKEELILNRVEIRVDLKDLELQAMLCNGFQTWSGTKYYTPSENIPCLHTVAKPLFKYYGDYYIDSPFISDQHLHSWTFTRLQFKFIHNELFLASNNDQLAYTLFAYCKKSKQLIITKELKDFPIKNSYPLFDIISGMNPGIQHTGSWETHHLYPNTNKENTLQSAWTSWYKYQQNITSNILNKELDDLKEQVKPDLFQIDDGYQTHIGDWLSFKDSLKTDLKPISQRIKKMGLTPGIWLAPFVVEPKSRIFKEHKDWIVKDQAGKPIKVGYNGVWKCWYYALDIYKTEVQNYLLKVFHSLKNEFGFEFFKLDFLFAACINPPKGVSKAQAMTFGMEFLKRATQDATLLSCGVPLASSFGIADISRVGPDTHLKWDFPLLKHLSKRERPSNFLALNTIICRYPFRNFSALDPDVYILRSNNKKEGLDLTYDQKRTHVLIASLFGDVQFTSDTVSDYTSQQKEILAEAKPFRNCTIQSIRRLQNDCYNVNTEEAALYINLGEQAKKISFKGHIETLEAYCTKIFYLDQ